MKKLVYVSKSTLIAQPSKFCPTISTFLISYKIEKTIQHVQHAQPFTKHDYQESAHIRIKKNCVYFIFAHMFNRTLVGVLPNAEAIHKECAYPYVKEPHQPT